MNSKKFLVVSTTGMGDCLWGTPGIRELKKAHPEAEIDLIVNKNWMDLFKHCPHLNHIYPYQNRWYAQVPLGLKLWVNKEYSHIFIFHANNDFKRMKPFLKSSPIWNHQGHKWCPEKFNIKSKLGEHSQSSEKDLHAIERRLLLLEEIDVEPRQPQMELFFSESEKNFFKDYKEKNGLKDPFAVCHIGASSVDRLWESKNFFDLANLILKETSLNIVFGGNKNEIEILKSLNLPDSDRIFFAFDMGILNYAYLLNEARLLVSNNTGPMHIGYAVNTPTIGIFQHVGNGHPERVGPFKMDETFFPVVSYLNGNTSVEEVWEKFQTIHHANEQGKKPEILPGS
ncbi:MAG: glycosyltransferase family 9 protein [Nitrospinota bacterium]